MGIYFLFFKKKRMSNQLSDQTNNMWHKIVTKDKPTEIDIPNDVSVLLIRMVVSESSVADFLESSQFFAVSLIIDGKQKITLGGAKGGNFQCPLDLSLSPGKYTLQLSGNHLKDGFSVEVSGERYFEDQLSEEVAKEGNMNEEAENIASKETIDNTSSSSTSDTSSSSSSSDSDTSESEPSESSSSSSDSSESSSSSSSSDSSTDDSSSSSDSESDSDSSSHGKRKNKGKKKSKTSKKVKEIPMKGDHRIERRNDSRGNFND